MHGALGPFSGAAVGVQVQRRDFRALGEGEDFLFPTLTDSFGVYGFAEAPIGSRVTLEFGGRYEDTEVEGTPISDVFTTRAFEPSNAPTYPCASSWSTMRAARA